MSTFVGIFTSPFHLPPQPSIGVEMSLVGVLKAVVDVVVVLVVVSVIIIVGVAVAGVGFGLPWCCYTGGVPRTTDHALPTAKSSVALTLVHTTHTNKKPTLL